MNIEKTQINYTSLSYTMKTSVFEDKNEPDLRLISDASPLVCARIQFLNDGKDGTTHNFVKEPNKTVHESSGSLQRRNQLLALASRFKQPKKTDENQFSKPQDVSYITNIRRQLFTLSWPISCAIKDSDVTNMTEPPLPISIAVAYTAFRPSTV